MAVITSKVVQVPEYETHIWQKFEVVTVCETVETEESKVWASESPMGGITVHYADSLPISSDGKTFAFTKSSQSFNFINQGLASTNPYISVNGANSVIAYYCNKAVNHGWSDTVNDYLLTFTASKKYERITTETKGDYISDVTYTDPNAYPENGIQDGYWYVKVV